MHCVGRPLVTDLIVENLHYLLERIVWREEYAVILVIQTTKTGQGKLVEKLTLILMIVLKHFHLHRVRATARLFVRSMFLCKCICVISRVLKDM